MTEDRAAIKARGAFYTPPTVAKFLAEWGIRSADDRVLEPACGDGAFIAASAARFAELHVPQLQGRLYGMELDGAEAVKARSLAPTSDIRVGSFFSLGPSDLPQMDVVIGNPPYIRYHGFAGEDRRIGLARAEAQGVRLTQMASSWAHFAVHSTSFLPLARGRLALVLPAELLHTDYAEPVRDFLTRRFTSVVVVAFDRYLFESAEVDAVLLLASFDDNLGLRVIRAADANALAALDIRPHLTHERRAPARRWSASIDGRSARLYADLAASGTAHPLSDYASVDIGVVTGANDYFVMTLGEAKSRGIPPSVLSPIVKRPADVRGLSVRDAEPHVLLNLRGRALPSSEQLTKYLEDGTAQGIDGRYKPRSRTPWYAVPLPKVRPHAFMPYMVHLSPRLIVNPDGAWSTNLLHGVAIKDLKVGARGLSAAMLSSVTLLSAEIEGRAYGGGVLKLETKEAERLLVPVRTPSQEASLSAAFDELDVLVRINKLAAASAKVDGILGIDRDRLVAAIEVYRSRRLGRRSSRKAA